MAKVKNYTDIVLGKNEINFGEKKPFHLLQRRRETTHNQ